MTQRNQRVRNIYQGLLMCKATWNFIFLCSYQHDELGKNRGLKYVNYYINYEPRYTFTTWAILSLLCCSIVKLQYSPHFEEGKNEATKTCITCSRSHKAINAKTPVRPQQVGLFLKPLWSQERRDKKDGAATPPADGMLSLGGAFQWTLSSSIH